MKRSIIIAAAWIGAIASASAQVNDATYYDLIRPHGRPRSDAIFQAALDFCYNQTGADRSQDDTPDFKRCMLGQHYRWLYTKAVPTPAAAGSIIYNRDSKDPGVGWHWEGGLRTCHYDCDNPEIPGSGYTCSDILWMGRPTRQCTKSN
jgi:hypothetical protein